ncbi:MAG: transglutaminaseTgpA domain-containing protein, partial [Prosthecobacter sp.]|nr:transglutaminaseTgpA domain-containing protein [Prosthecobacter sp.]
MARRIPPRPTRPTPGLRVRGTVHTVSVIGVILAMGYAGAVQANSVAYLLCFTTLVLTAMSWLRARENLRSIELRSRLPTTRTAGENSHLPLEIHAPTGPGAFGLEVINAQGGSWSFVENVPPGGTQQISLPGATSGRLCVLLRSAYPLGLFSVERVVELSAHHPVRPRPAGHLPLPMPDKEIAGEKVGQQPAASRPGQEGDDFAGLRQWHPGDSLRHVDWRAVARGRPLLVKQWASGSSQAVTLDWEKLPLPEAERAGQIARWITQAETIGLPYALKLPGQPEISPGLGPSHQNRCMDALADFAAPPASVDESLPKKLPPGHERSAQLAPWPLLVLCGILLAAGILLLDLVPPVAVLFFTGCAIWRLGFAEPGWKNRKQRQRPAAPPTPTFSAASLAILLAGLAAVQASTGDLMSMAGGIAALLILLGAKLLESRSPHDFQILAVVGWFLCLCSLLSSQTLSRSLSSFAVFIGITLCMVRFRQGIGGWRMPLRLTLTLLAQAIPVAVLLFLLFPRSSLHFLERMGSQRSHVTGISSSLEPGRISKIATSNEVAFRVEFPETEPPAHAARYWRCLVLWQCDDGLTWQRGLPQEGIPRLRLRRRSDTRQIITLEPHGQRWLPALDLPIQGIDEGHRILPDVDEAMTAPQNVESLRRFEVVSRLTQELGEITPSQRQAALRLPPGL